MGQLRLGIWAPLPHAIRPEPQVERALADLGTQGVGASVDRSYAFVRAVVQRAEILGFDLTLIAERFVARDLEAWVVASALAVETSRIELLTAVHPGIVPPQVVAKMAASLDRLSGGRCSINVVPGRRSEEFDLYGNGSWLGDSVERYRRMDEFIAVMKGLWLNDRLDHAGAFFNVKDAGMATKTVRSPCPPVYAASSAEAGKDIIARTCDTWFVSHDAGLDAYEANVSRIAADIADMRRRAGAHGRALGYGISTHVICHDTWEAAEREARDLETHAASNVAVRALGAGLVGDPRQIADRIKRYQAVGVDCLMLQFHPMRDGLERFAAQVMPLLR